MNDIDLCWRAEEACMNAWPSPRQAVFEGWLLRAAGGPIRRTNSVNPLRGGRGDLGRMMAVAETVYSALGQDVLFRVPSFVDGMAETLAAAGFAEEGRTLTLYAEKSARNDTPHAGLAISAEADAAWLAARARMNGVSAADQAVYETMLRSIVLPKAFAAAKQDGEIAALAYGVVGGGLAVIESVVSDPSRRRQGHGRRAVGSLLAWAWTAGAEAACLQVVADNTPAVSLYHTLGFTRELYRYRYFRKAD